MKDLKFAMSYSFGKDSAFAMYKMIEAGHEPICLITAINERDGRSWFHGISQNLAEKIADSIGLPIITASSTGTQKYVEAFTNALLQAKIMGAEVCVFGDMDIEEHLEWNKNVCNAAELECITPLWGTSRETSVKEEIESGITAVIKVVDHKYLDDEFLGRELTTELVDKIRQTGADVCGENGEYHTLVTYAPFYKAPVHVHLGEIVQIDGYGAIDIF